MGTTLLSLPTELIDDIATRLPASSLLNLRLCCRELAIKSQNAFGSELAEATARHVTARLQGKEFSEIYHFCGHRTAKPILGIFRHTSLASYTYSVCIHVPMFLGSIDPHNLGTLFSSLPKLKCLEIAEKLSQVLLHHMHNHHLERIELTMTMGFVKIADIITLISHNHLTLRSSSSGSKRFSRELGHAFRSDGKFRRVRPPNFDSKGNNGGSQQRPIYHLRRPRADSVRFFRDCRWSTIDVARVHHQGGEFPVRHSFFVKELYQQRRLESSLELSMW